MKEVNNDVCVCVCVCAVCHRREHIVHVDVCVIHLCTDVGHTGITREFPPCHASGFECVCVCVCVSEIIFSVCVC